MWILYFLASSDEDISQQELIEMMMFPKQTINSSVKTLSEKGLLTLEMIPGTRNKKRILLTEGGRKKAGETSLFTCRKSKCRRFNGIFLQSSGRDVS